MSDGASEGQGNTGAGEGQGTTSFLDGFTSDELKGNETFRSFDSLDAFGQNHIDLTKAHDDLKSEHETLKANLPIVPESIDGYSVELPDGMEVDEVGMNTFKDFALENKVPQDLFPKLVQFDAARQAAAVKQLNEQKDTALQEIKDKHGENYPAELQKVNKILKVAAQGDEFFEEMNVEDYPKMFKVLSFLGSKISEDSLQTGGEGTGQGSEEKDPAKSMFGDMPGLPKK